MTLFIILLVLFVIIGAAFLIANSGKPGDKNNQNWHNLYMNRLDR